MKNISFVLVTFFILSGSVYGNKVDSMEKNEFSFMFITNTSAEVNFNNLYKNPFPTLLDLSIEFSPLFSKGSREFPFPIIGFDRYRGQHLATGNLRRSNAILIGVGKRIYGRKIFEETHLLVFTNALYTHYFIKDVDHNFIDKRDFGRIHLELNCSIIWTLKSVEFGPLLKISLPSSLFKVQDFQFPIAAEQEIGLIIKI